MKLLILTLLVACATPILGQSAPVRVQILTISIDTKIENSFFQSDGKIQPFKADPSDFGEPLSYVGPSQFMLRGAAEEFTAQPPGPLPLATVQLPEKATVVLLIGGHTPEAKLKLTAYDISAGGFRAGDYRVFNFSEKAVSLILGRAKFALKPGEDNIVSDVALQDNVLDVVVQIAQVEAGVPQRVYTSAWGHQPIKRNFVFLFNGNHPTRPIAIRRFSDYPSKK